MESLAAGSAMGEAVMVAVQAALFWQWARGITLRTPFQEVHHMWEISMSMVNWLDHQQQVQEQTQQAFNQLPLA
jgi:hypothetical protein